MIPYLDKKEAEAILNKAPHLKDEFISKIRNIERVWEPHLMPDSYLAIADAFHFLKQASNPTETRPLNYSDIQLLERAGDMMAERDSDPILNLHKKYTKICLTDPLDDYVFGTVGRVVHQVEYQEMVSNSILSSFLLSGSFKIQKIADGLKIRPWKFFKAHSQRVQTISYTMEEYFKEGRHLIEVDRKERPIAPGSSP